MALITASRKLKHCFDTHPIKVLTSCLIKTVLRKADLSGRTKKWLIELGIFHIEYEPRITYKGQILADFITEYTGNGEVEPDNLLPAPTGGKQILRC